MKDKSIFSNFEHGLIVSCQALPDEPLYGSEHMAVMAKAASLGGAVGIRANFPQDIAAIRKMVSLPIIGLYKKEFFEVEVYITPTIETATEVSNAGADIIAIDATLRPHPFGKSAADLAKEIHQKLNRPILADIDNLAAGLSAEAAGFDAVSTTMSGYTKDSPSLPGPDFELIGSLAKRLSIPVIAEGRFWSVEEVNQAFSLGAYAVVIGAAITRPMLITKRFVQGIK